MAVTGQDKVFVVNANINTAFGGVDPTGSFQTISDLKSYKVFAANIFQDGEDGSTNSNQGSLDMGVTYRINANSPGMDFTNVGAPNNDLDTYFIATGEVPASWGVDEGSINILKYDKGAPVVVIMENTLGNVWFKYDGVGQYTMESTNLFADFKTWFAKPIYSKGLDQVYMYYDTSDKLWVESTQDNVGTNDVLTSGASIEVRVYN